MSDDATDIVRVAPQQRSPLAIAVKRIVQTILIIFAAPYLLAYWIGGLIWGRDRSFLQTSEWIGSVPGMVGVYLRQAFFRRTLRKCGDDCYFGWLSTFSMPQASLGESVYIGRRCSIGYANLENNVMLADGVQILSGGREHPLAHDDEILQETGQEFREVTIGSGAWIGTNAVVMADVGAGAIIGAGAVVNKPIPPRCVAVGVPARVIKQLS